MRITRETLLKLARETASLRVHQDRSIVTIYLVGSLLKEQPLLGGTTDIDLVMVHDSQPLQEREIVRMSDEVHLDIAHYSQAAFDQPRQLRVDPWLGPSINNHPLLFHDTQHWFEFTQASAGSQFDRPDYILGRARPLAENARQIWLQLHSSPAGQMPFCQVIQLYLRALSDSANAIASLSGSPLVERRFLLEFPERASAIGQEGLAKALVALAGDGLVEPEVISNWLPAWKAAFEAAGSLPEAPTRLCPPRLLYYQQAIRSMVEGDQPWTALWPMMSTWSQAVCSLPESSPHREPWLMAARQLHLGEEDIPDRLAGFDGFLDRVEETLDNWGRDNGVYESS